MKLAGQFSLCLAAVSLFLYAARADELAMADNPYSAITERNVFALIPIPTNSPVTDTAPVDPPPKIIPNGIMTLFGKLQVLFKVTLKAQPGQPPKELSKVMGEGDREDDITVTKIDDKAGIITFDNHGVVQELSLVDAPNQTTPAVGGGAGNIPMPNRPGGPIGIGMIGRGGLGVARSSDGGGSSSSSPATPSAGGSASASASASAGNGQPASQPLTAEEQVINMETQRAKWLDEKNPAAAIIPPTKLGEALIGGDEAPPAPTPPSP